MGLDSSGAVIKGEATQIGQDNLSTGILDVRRHSLGNLDAKIQACVPVAPSPHPTEVGVVRLHHQGGATLLCSEVQIFQELLLRGAGPSHRPHLPESRHAGYLQRSRPCQELEDIPNPDWHRDGKLVFEFALALDVHRYVNHRMSIDMNHMVGGGAMRVKDAG